MIPDFSIWLLNGARRLLEPLKQRRVSISMDGRGRALETSSMWFARPATVARSGTSPR
jgi:hypothetical protein